MTTAAATAAVAVAGKCTVVYSYKVKLMHRCANMLPITKLSTNHQAW